MASSPAPSLTLPAGTPLYRIHRAVNSPAFFDTGPSGRFNAPGALSSNFGTLYLATSPDAAFVETLGRTKFLRPTDIDARRLTTVTFARALHTLRLDSRANRFRYPDVDLAADAIATRTDWTGAQDLAGLVWGDADESFDGITYPVRHDNAHELMGVAVFGEPGSHPPGDVFATAKILTIPASLVEHMITQFGFEVLLDTPLP